MTERTFTRAEIEEMVEDNTDSFGNLYRIDFLHRVKYEAETGLERYATTR